MPDKSMEEDFVRSESKSPGRRIWSLGSRLRVPASLLVFLDAELYLEHVFAAQVVRQLEEEGRIPAAVSVFISNNGSAARHSDYVCDIHYSHFLVNEVLPFVLARNPRAASE